MIIELVPPDRAGGIRVGSSREEIRTALSRYGDVESLDKGETYPSLFVYAQEVGLGIFTYFDRSGRAEAIELGRPVEGVEVRYDGVDVFATPVDELIPWLRERTRVAERGHGSSYRAEDLLLAFWRSGSPQEPEDEDWRYFESVLLAKPEYYDRNERD